MPSLKTNGWKRRQIRTARKNNLPRIVFVAHKRVGLRFHVREKHRWTDTKQAVTSTVSGFAEYLLCHVKFFMGLNFQQHIFAIWQYFDKECISAGWKRLSSLTASGASTKTMGWQRSKAMVLRRLRGIFYVNCLMSSHKHSWSLAL